MSSIKHNLFTATLALLIIAGPTTRISAHQEAATAFTTGVVAKGLSLKVGTFLMSATIPTLQMLPTLVNTLIQVVGSTNTAVILWEAAHTALKSYMHINHVNDPRALAINNAYQSGKDVICLIDLMNDLQKLGNQTQAALSQEFSTNQTSAQHALNALWAFPQWTASFAMGLGVSYLSFAAGIKIGLKAGAHVPVAIKSVTETAIIYTIGLSLLISTKEGLKTLFGQTAFAQCSICSELYDVASNIPYIASDVIPGFGKVLKVVPAAQRAVLGVDLSGTTPTSINQLTEALKKNQ